jgi:hypothetical protein
MSFNKIKKSLFKMHRTSSKSDTRITIEDDFILQNKLINRFNANMASTPIALRNKSIFKHEDVPCCSCSCKNKDRRVYKPKPEDMHSIVSHNVTKRVKKTHLKRKRYSEIKINFVNNAINQSRENIFDSPVYAQNNFFDDFNQFGQFKIWFV